MTPIFFGSALKNFGVGDLLNALGELAPSPRTQAADKRVVSATEPGMSAFVFKIQANMDPNHRDRIAFVRLCSGKLTRGMKVKQTRTEKPMSLRAPQFFFAQDRALAEEAYAGDVVGIPNHGTLRIGDTLTEGEDLNFVGVPNFAPEILRRVCLSDAMKAKKLQAGAGRTVRGRRRPGVPARRRRRSMVGVGGLLPARCPQGQARRRIRTANRLGYARISIRALDLGGQSQDRRSLCGELHPSSIAGEDADGDPTPPSWRAPPSISNIPAITTRILPFPM